MALTNINKCPRFTKHLVSLKAFDSKRLSVVDVGARGGFESHWSFYGDQVRLIGFEPDLEECNRLNQQVSNTENCYFPFALAQSIGKRTFYVTAYPSSSGFYKPDMRFLHRFPDEVNLTVVKEIEIDTIDLDSFSRENGLKVIDFMKLDAEGGELPILKGAERLLKKSGLGLSVEVEFCPFHEGQPLFGEVDSFLSPLGFVLFDLSCYRHSRKALPGPRWFGQGSGGLSKRGQIIWGQALYLRDAVDELNFSNKLEDGWDDLKLLKLASIMELFNLPDCAIELMQVARQKGFLQGWNVDYLIDLCVPGVEDRTFSRFWPRRRKGIYYNEYMHKIAMMESSSAPDRNRRLFIKILPRPIRRGIRFCLTKIKDFIERILT
jgi:FkbM family methyltransferase